MVFIDHGKVVPVENEYTQKDVKSLTKAWELRDPATPLKTPEEALILASIVEKETGQASDRAQVAGVFTNRLRKGMLLQTDPTVIYGLGENFDGRLRKVHLQTDTPWNTYTRPRTRSLGGAGRSRWSS